MQQQPVFLKLVLMPLSQHQNHLILINYAKISYRVVSGMENHLEDVKIPQLLVLIIQDHLLNVDCFLNRDSNALKQLSLA